VLEIAEREGMAYPLCDHSIDMQVTLIISQSISLVRTRQHNRIQRIGLSDRTKVTIND